MKASQSFFMVLKKSEFFKINSLTITHYDNLINNDLDELHNYNITLIRNLNDQMIYIFNLFKF